MGRKKSIEHLGTSWDSQFFVRWTKKERGQYNSGHLMLHFISFLSEKRHLTPPPHFHTPIGKHKQKITKHYLYS